MYYFLELGLVEKAIIGLLGLSVIVAGVTYSKRASTFFKKIVWLSLTCTIFVSSVLLLTVGKHAGVQEPFFILSTLLIGFLLAGFNPELTKISTILVVKEIGRGKKGWYLYRTAGLYSLFIFLLNYCLLFVSYYLLKIFSINLYAVTNIVVFGLAVATGTLYLSSYWAKSHHLLNSHYLTDIINKTIKQKSSFLTIFIVASLATGLNVLYFIVLALVACLLITSYVASSWFLILVLSLTIALPSLFYGLVIAYGVKPIIILRRIEQSSKSILYINGILLVAISWLIIIYKQ